MSGADEQIDDLHKKYRIIEGDRKAFSEEGQQVLRRQRANIEKLKGDNQQLKEELALEKKHSKVHENVSAQAQISKLQDTGDIYTRKIELEKRRIEELDKQARGQTPALVCSPPPGLSPVPAARADGDHAQEDLGAAREDGWHQRVAGEQSGHRQAGARRTKPLRTLPRRAPESRAATPADWGALRPGRLTRLSSLPTRQIQILENRLDKALKKYNEALAHNKRLRENIDNLRRERLVFDQIYKKLEKELAEKKKEMARIIEISNKAYEARDAAQQEMAGLKAQADKEQSEFEAEWKELGRMIEQDRKMKDFMKKEREKMTMQEHRGEMTIEEEQKLKKKVLKGNWGIAKDKASIHASMEKVQSYEEAFAKIQAATGISDIDELVTTFINAEDQNFALFNYVNELNGECEKLEEQIADIKSEIEKYKGQGLNTDNQRKKILKDLEERLSRTEAKAEQYEKKHEGAMKTVNALKLGIQSIFNKIGCNTAANMDLLGNEGVTEANMMQYLGIIEQRTNEILQLYAATQAQARDADAPGGAAMTHILGQGPQLPAGSNSITIQPPSTGDDDGLDSDDDSADEDEDRPFSRDELKAKTIRGLQKRESKDKKKDGKRKGKGGK